MQFDGAQLSFWWAVPFIGLLLSIALLPLKYGEFWEKHFGKVSLFWGLCLVVPMWLLYGFDTTQHHVLEVYLGDYIPFIILLLALFAISGGIRITGTLKATPKSNIGILLVGTLLASWMGTTGAAMLMIRPLLRANAERKYKVHTVVFFIFLVCNVGGSLTPLGDPPLFLGFLRGVGFFWTTTHIWLETLFVVAVLLSIYALWDSLLYRRESPQLVREIQYEPLGMEGKANLFLLAGVVGFVLFSGVAKLGSVSVLGIELPVAGVIRDVGLLALTYLSWKITSQESRRANGFTWGPILEVGYLFAGIFVTIIAPLAMLQAAQHNQGALQAVHHALFTSTGDPIDAMFFWITGILSSFLDNAPTYLIFFDAAGGDAAHLMADMATTLVAISAGAVFFGAVTYIGNAPNFMIKSIAEESGIKMPSFGGYIVWSLGILGPVYLLVTVIFFI